MEKQQHENKLDIEAILKKQIKNVRVEEVNKPNMDLFAKGFYEVYIKP